MKSWQSAQEAIESFKERAKIEPEYCLELFEHATTRLMAHKYAYYVHSQQFVDDYAYDGEEQSWFIMGRALGLLKEDETSPCIDFDHNHPFAARGIELANKLKFKGKP